MKWIIFSLFATFLWSVVNVVDKYLISKYSDDKSPAGALVMFSSLIGFIASFFIAIFHPEVFSIDGGVILPLFIVGFLNVAWIIFYLHALQDDDASVVSSWFLVQPVFAYLGGMFFLGEKLLANQIIGGLVILLGALVISIDFRNKKVKLKKKTTILMGLSVLCAASAGLVFKAYVPIEDFWISSFWEYLGFGLAGLVLFCIVPPYRKGFIKMLKTGGKAILSLNLGSEAVTIVGNLFQSFALLLAPVAMVYLFSSFQPVFVLIFGLLATKIFTGVVKEDISKKVLLQKAVAFIIMILGTYFIVV